MDYLAVKSTDNGQGETRASSLRNGPSALVLTLHSPFAHAPVLEGLTCPPVPSHVGYETGQIR